MIDKEEKESKEKFEVRLDVGKGEVKDDFKIFEKKKRFLIHCMLCVKPGVLKGLIDPISSP